MAYDRQFRLEALARRDLNWSAANSRLYNEAFTGRARPIRHCSICHQESHLTHNCPRNPHHPSWGWPPDPIEWSGHSSPLPKGSHMRSAGGSMKGSARCKGADTATPVAAARGHTLKWTAHTGVCSEASHQPTLHGGQPHYWARQAHVTDTIGITERNPGMGHPNVVWCVRLLRL